MRVRDVGTDDFPKRAGAEDLFHVFAEFFDGVHEGLIILIWQIVNFVDFVFWNDESMAF